MIGKASELKIEFDEGYGFDDLITELEQFNGDDVVYLDDMGNVHLYECDDYKKKKILVIKEVLREFGIYEDTLGACEDIYNRFKSKNLRKGDGTLVPMWKITARVDEIMEQ